MAKLSMKDLEKILAVTLTGMTVDEFQAEVRKWLETAKDPQWHRPYSELAYQRMLEVMGYLRANGYKTYIHWRRPVFRAGLFRKSLRHHAGAGGGPADGTKYGYDKSGRPILTKEPKLLLNDNNAGKPEGLHLIIGHRPYAAFGNSTGNLQMLEFTAAGDGARLMMLVLHDDGKGGMLTVPLKVCRTPKGAPLPRHYTMRPGSVAGWRWI